MARSGLPDAESWWGEPGRPGWMPEVWQGTAYPPAYAGLVLGGWRLEQPGRAPDLPWPGLMSARVPLAWYDTLAVAPDGGGAAAGFGAAATGLHAASRAVPGRAHSTFSLANGEGGVDENALVVARGDSATGVQVESMSGRRGAAAGIEGAGRHRWGADLWLTRGHHRFEGAFSQRGSAAKLAGGEEQSGAGRSGSLGWRWAAAGWRAGLGFARGFDHHESFGGPLDFSRREAQDVRVVAEAERARGGRTLGARVEWSRAQVERFGSGAFGAGSRSLWAAARADLPLAGGRLAAALGAGRHEGIDRTDVAPSLRWARRVRGLDATLTLERVLTPVWSDLAPGQAPFLQHAWLAGVRATTARQRPWRARASVLGGRVYSRALAERLPLEELWLRTGLRAEPGTCDLVLGEGGVEWDARRGDAGLEGFALGTRTPLAAATRQDPRAGFRAWVGGRAALFGGDLGVHLRAELEGVSRRQAETDPPVALPAFVTVGVAGEFVVSDATITVRVRNLDDRAREQTWIDAATGRLALAGRRDLRIAVTWRLFN